MFLIKLSLEDWTDAAARAHVAQLFIEATSGPVPHSTFESVETRIILTAGAPHDAPIITGRIEIEQLDLFPNRKDLYAQAIARQDQARELLTRYLDQRVPWATVEPGILLQPGMLEDVAKLVTRQHLWKLEQPGGRDAPETRTLTPLWTPAPSPVFAAAAADNAGIYPAYRAVAAQLAMMPLGQTQIIAGAQVTHLSKDGLLSRFSLDGQARTGSEAARDLAKRLHEQAVTGVDWTVAPYLPAYRAMSEKLGAMEPGAAAQIAGVAVWRADHDIARFQVEGQWLVWSDAAMELARRVEQQSVVTVEPFEPLDLQLAAMSPGSEAVIAGLHVARLDHARFVVEGFEDGGPVGIDRAAGHLERAHAAQLAARWEHPID